MWYILQVATGSEAHMKETLKQFLGKELLKEVFYPMYESSYKKGGVRQIVTRVLFPGYLFLDTEEIGRLEERLKDLTEFQHLLSVGKLCTPVGREEQDFLESHTTSGHTLCMSRGYMMGRKVMITEGAFASYCGPLKYVDRHNRYGVITVRLGERDIDMRFGLEIVEKVDL